MSERKINLEEILWSIFDPDVNDCTTEREDLQLEITLNPDLDRIKMAMIKFGEQLLELAAENADVKAISEMISISNGADFNIQKMVVDKQSILNTIKQVE